MTSGPPEITLLPSFASSNDAAFMQLSAAVISKSWDGELYVSPLGRAGFSGARLYKCHMPGGRLFVVKIDDFSSIKNEAAAIDEIQPFLPVPVMFSDPVVRGREGALVYPFVGGGNQRSAEEVHELHEIAYEDSITCSDGPKPVRDEEVERVVAQVYDSLLECESVSLVATSLRTEYKRYLRKRQGTLTLQCILGKLFRKSRFEFLGARCRNPDEFLDDPRFDLATRLKCGPIHGDFHPKNVMVDKRWNPHIIDFAWANKRAHRLKDYVLMECSLRFNVFPRKIELGTQNSVDDALLRFDGTEAVKRLTKSSPLQKEYRRMALIVRQIRSAAQPFFSTSGDNGFSEYLAAQFLVLHGLLRYPDYHNASAVRALGMIANHLYNRWAPTSDAPA